MMLNQLMYDSESGLALRLGLCGEYNHQHKAIDIHQRICHEWNYTIPRLSKLFFPSRMAMTVVTSCLWQHSAEFAATMAWMLLQRLSMQRHYNCCLSYSLLFSNCFPCSTIILPCNIRSSSWHGIDLQVILLF